MKLSENTIDKGMSSTDTFSYFQMEENCRRSTRTKEHKNYLEMASGKQATQPSKPLVERSTNTKHKKPKRNFFVL